MKYSLILKHFRAIWKSSLLRPCPTVRKFEFRAETVRLLPLYLLTGNFRRMHRLELLRLFAKPDP